MFHVTRLISGLIIQRLTVPAGYFQKYPGFKSKFHLI